jgi:hypothetical protein
MSIISQSVWRVSSLMPYTKILRPRPVASVMYLLYMLAGAAFLFLTADGVRALFGDFLFIVWNTFYFGGALLGLIGSQLVKRYVVEVVGHPFLISALIAYGVYLAWLVPTSSQDGTILGLAFTFLAAGVSLLGRSIEVGRIVWIQSDLYRRRHG